LASVLDILEPKFEAANPCTDLIISLGSSSTLATQIREGAAADAFISAAKSATEDLPETFSSITPFLNNELVVAMVANGKIITSPNLLNTLNWARCVDEAPCGKIAVAALKSQSLDDTPTTIAQDAAQLKQLLMSGEIEAALLYHSDVVSNAELREVFFADTASATTTYFIASKDDSGSTNLRNFLKSSQATQQFTQFGFVVLP
jgi:molybdate transport system substrate-binding protein